MGINVILLLLYVGIIKVSNQNAIITDSAILFDTYDSHMRMTDSGCECIKYDCGCCQYMEWDMISLNGKLCLNVSYLAHDYGISVTVTFNNFVIINETVSARDPPPICIGEDIVSQIKMEICLHIFDINISYDKFHACFEIFCKFMKFETPTIRLGCVDTKINKIQKDVKNNIFNLSLLCKKNLKYPISPNIIMV